MTGIVSTPGNALAARSAGMNAAYGLGGKPAAPTAAPVKPGPKPLSIAQQASQLANQSIADQVAAIQAQQQQQLAQSRAEAQQLVLASQGGAQYLSGLGTPTYDTYKDAATTLAGLSGGFSGQLRDAAQAQADQAAHDIASVGGNQAAVNNRAPDLANVLYGMRGLQPASTLLNAGAAAAARENAAPQGLLGYGQNLALGALGAGKSAADALTSNILQAQGQRGSLTQQYLSQLASAQTDAEKLQIARDLAQSLTSYRKGELTVANNKVIADQNKAIAAANAKVAAADRAAGVRTAAAARPNATLSRAVGYIVDSNGQPIPGPDGNRQVLPGFKVSKSGQIVKTSTAKGAAAGANPDFPNLTKSQVLHLRAIIAQTYSGVPAQTGPDGKTVIKKELPPLDYQAAINEAISEGFSRAGATKMADRFYKPGQRGRPMTPKQKKAAAATAKATQTALAPPAWTQ